MTTLLCEVVDDCPVCFSTAMARRLQAFQDGVCLPAHWAGALPAWQVGATFLQQQLSTSEGAENRIVSFSNCIDQAQLYLHCYYYLHYEKVSRSTFKMHCICGRG